MKPNSRYNTTRSRHLQVQGDQLGLHHRFARRALCWSDGYSQGGGPLHPHATEGQCQLLQAAAPAPPLRHGHHSGHTVVDAVAVGEGLEGEEDLGMGNKERGGG